MADLVNQSSPNPTNKLTAAVVAAAVVAVGQVIADIIWPGVLDGKFWGAMYPIAVYAAGYFVKDNANVVVVQQVIATEVPVGEAKP